MKKRLLIIVLLLGLLIVPFKEVFAEGEEDTPVTAGGASATSAWPKSFNHGDYDFSIEGIILNVYEQHLSANSQGKMVASSEDLEKYLANNPDRVITLDPTKFTINPTYKEDKFFDNDATFINLGLNLTKEDLEELLSTELSNTSETKNYMVEIAIQYKLTNYPETYKHGYGVNLMKVLLGVMTGNENFHELDFTKVNTQTYYTIQISYDKDNDTAVFDYDTEATEDNGAGANIFNFILLSDIENPTVVTSEEMNEEIDGNNHLLIFHNFENVDYLIEHIKEIQESTGESAYESYDVGVDDTEESKVAVPDTAKNFPLYLYLFSVIVMASGITIIARTVYKEQQAKY